MSRKSKNPARKLQEIQPKKHREVKLLGGLAAGMIAGVVATWVLDKYQQGAVQATRRVEDATGAEPFLSRQQEEHLREQHRAHADTAKRIAKSATGKKLSRSQQQNGAIVVRYAAGALAGAAYGLTAEFLPAVRRWYGMGYSKAIFLGGSEPLLPWLGMSNGQAAPVTPAGLPAPLVFGAAMETTRRFLRWML
jgi:F0F1-type ATP synthase assembly protein I